MEYIGTARLIDGMRINDARNIGKEEMFKNRWIEDEKEWIRCSIELTFKKRGLKPVEGSEVEFKITQLNNGDIKIEGKQPIAETQTDKEQ